MYNFDEIIDRKGTNALNTDGFRGYIFHAGPEKVFPYKDDEFVRMWVADMEFGVAPETKRSCVLRNICTPTSMESSAHTPHTASMLKSSGMPHIRVRRKPVIYQYMGLSLMICCMLNPPMENVIWVGS